MNHLELHFDGPPKEYKGIITYSTFETRFGNCLVASTEQGICNVMLFDDFEEAFDELKKRWEKTELIEWPSDSHDQIRDYFNEGKIDSPIKLHLHGTPFQKKVWESLLKIEPGQTSTYAEIAKATGKSKAFQAVGGAVGDNPIAYLIPCHRVLKSTGEMSGYRWGVERKRAMLGWESLQQDTTNL